jgi:hypothetical protein
MTMGVGHKYSGFVVALYERERQIRGSSELELFLRECSVVKKAPDRVPGGNGRAALAVGILDQGHDPNEAQSHQPVA